MLTKRERASASTLATPTMLTGLSLTTRPFKHQCTTTQPKSQITNSRSLVLHLLLLADKALELQRKHLMATLSSNGDGEDRRHLQQAQKHRQVRDAMIGTLARRLNGGGER